MHEILTNLSLNNGALIYKLEKLQNHWSILILLLWVCEMKRLLYAEKTFRCHGCLINQLSDPKYAITAWALRVIIFILLHSAKEQLPKVKWFGQCDGERERQGGRWKGERWRGKKEVKQERKCEVGETEREGERKREKERWLVLAVKNVSRMIISQWQGSYSAEGGVCKWSAPGHIHMHTHWPCSVMGKKWKKNLSYGVKLKAIYCTSQS